jgi:membrane protein YqaA with SNARE-associated domain
VIDAVARFADDRRAAWLLAGWAAAEAIFLPIVPDVGLALLVLGRPQRAVPLYAAVIVGGVVGSVVMHGLVAADPAAIERLLLTVPGIDASMLADVERRIGTDGIAAFGQVGPGTPLKAWTAGWAETDGNVAGAIGGAVLNRLTRIGPVVVAAWVAGRLGGGWLRHHERLAIGLYAAFWILVYALLLL